MECWVCVQTVRLRHEASADISFAKLASLTKRN
jgi:hypothetical protein